MKNEEDLEEFEDKWEGGEKDEGLIWGLAFLGILWRLWSNAKTENGVPEKGESTECQVQAEGSVSGFNYEVITQR